MMPIKLEQKLMADQSPYFSIDFFAMASPCHLLINTQDQTIAHKIAELCINEVKRIEQKYSRYLVGNICHKINTSQGKPIAIDEETFRLLQYAQQLHHMSDGLFDITSGVLAKLWQFKPNATPPESSKVKAILQHIGFNRLQFTESELTLECKMQLDFGGLVKEYCVDACAKLIQPLAEKFKISFLINLGGDLVAMNLNPSHLPWHIGIESFENNTLEHQANNEKIIQLSQGAVATSGSANRYFDYQGKRYAHILNPRTGYPIEGAPRSVTTFAQTCTLAGSLSTLAQLQGAKAEQFLQQQGVEYLCCW
jgi:FAD:protein FMN transferase